MRALSVPLLAAALCLSAAARAERVVILPLDGDQDNRLREQLERAVKHAKKLEVIDHEKFDRVSSRKPLHSAAHAKTASRDVAYDVAVRGALTDSFFVQIVDASNQELWSKDLPVREGLLSTDNARRLANAIAVAAESAGTSAAPAPAAAEEASAVPNSAAAVAIETDAPVIKTAPAAAAKSESSEAPSEGAVTMPGLDLTGGDAPSHLDASPPAADADLEAEVHRKPRHVAPKLIEVQVTGTTTWRSYCARPGVSSCGAYDAMSAASRPAGTTVDFSPAVPYPGIGATAVAFPLENMRNLAKGLGVEAQFSRGFSVTNVGASTASGSGTSQTVLSTDDSYEGMALFRYFFDLGGDRQQPLLAHVGVRAGLVGRTFEVDPTAKVPLPGAHRRFPAVGLDGSYSFWKFLRADATVLYFISPQAGADELIGYGSSVNSTGWGMRAGLGGDIWGPLGYVVRFEYQSYQDQFSGKGNVWGSGGAAQESYAGLFWGATAQF